MKNKENAIEFMTGENMCVVSLTSPKRINRVQKLYSERKDDFVYLHENADGSICAKFPERWIKINPPAQREYTEEERQRMAERMRQYKNR